MLRENYHRDWMREHREENREDYNAYMRDYNARNPQKRQRVKMAEFIRSYKAEHPCIDCGEDDPVCLDFDHKDPKKKLFRVSNFGGKSWAALKAEIKKCVIRCANCHRKKTARMKEGGYARKR